MPTVLSEVTLDEVSLVDKPANQHSKILLLKRDGGSVLSKAPAGVQFNIGFKEDGGSEIQSVVFDAQHWDEERAKKWLADHNLTSEKLDKTPNTLRFRQHDPEGYVRFRMIKPGAQITKALALHAEDSLQRTMALVSEAIREKFSKNPENRSEPAMLESFIFIRDFYEDQVVFEQGGECYRVEYEIVDLPDGGTRVELSEKIPVSIVYQDAVAKTEGVAPPTISEELHARVIKLYAELAHLRNPRSLIGKYSPPHNHKFRSGR